MFDLTDIISHFALHSWIEIGKRQWDTTHACIIRPKKQMSASFMDITRAASSSPGAEVKLHIVLDSRVQRAFKEEIKLKT